MGLSCKVVWCLKLTSAFNGDSLETHVSREHVGSFFGFSGCTKMTSVRTQLRPSSPVITRLNLEGSGTGPGASILLPAGEQERLLAASSLLLLLLLHTLLASWSGSTLSLPPVVLLVSLALSFASSSES